jgi:hypothetical protein
MGLLRTFLSKPVGEVAVCDGDIQHGSWDYWTDHRLATIGNLGTKNLYLTRKLLSIRRLEGKDADVYVQSGKDIFGAGKRVLGAMMGGAAGVAIGANLAQKDNAKLTSADLVCFEAALTGGKRFVALTSPKVFDALVQNHSKASR